MKLKALALTFLPPDDDRLAVSDHVSVDRMRSAVDDRAEPALLGGLPYDVAYLRTRDDLLRRRIGTADSRADGPSPLGAGGVVPGRNEADDRADNAEDGTCVVAHASPHAGR